MLKMYKPSPEIVNAFFILTRQCNLRCTYCYEKHTSEEMSEEVAIDGVDFLFRNGVKGRKKVVITFFGGEPTLKPDLMELIVEESVRRSKETGVKFDITIISNCTQYPQKMHDLFVKYKGSIEFFIQLSIDGPSEIQDQYRIFPNGTGSWSVVDKVLDKWIEAEKEGLINLCVHSCVNKKTIGDVFRIYHYFRETRGVEKIWIIPIPESDWTDEDVKAYQEENEKLYKFIVSKCLFHESFKEIFNYAPFDKCKMTGPRSVPCGAGTTFGTIMPNGDLAACHQLGLQHGSIPIGDIWMGVDDNKRRIYTEYSDEDMGCNDCEHTACYRCIAANYDDNKSMFMRNSEYQCKMMLVDYEFQKKLRNFMGEHRGFNK